MMTYSLLATLLLAGALFACLQRTQSNTLPQEALSRETEAERLSEKKNRR